MNCSQLPLAKQTRKWTEFEDDVISEGAAHERFPIPMRGHDSFTLVGNRQAGYLNYL